MSSTTKKKSTKECGDIIHINGNIGYSTNNNNNSSEKHMPSIAVIVFIY